MDSSFPSNTFLVLFCCHNVAKEWNGRKMKQKWIQSIEVQEQGPIAINPEQILFTTVGINVLVLYFVLCVTSSTS
jgi:hypothetical protein